MHNVLLQFKKNLMPASLMRLLMAEGRLTVITEPDTEQVFEPHVEIHLVADSRNVELVRKTLLGILRTQPVDQLLTPYERNQTTGGYLRSLLCLPGRGFEVANNCTSKFAMKRCYVAAGLPTPEFDVAYSLDDIPAIAQRLGWPLIAKPVLGGGGNHVTPLRTREAFDAFASSPAAKELMALGLPLLVEKMVEMSGEYHCDGVVVAGRVELAVTSRYFSPLLGCDAERNGSYTLPDDHPDAVEIRALHERAVAALGLRDSVTHMELFKTADGFVCGEIAGRVAGGGIAQAIELRHGIDLWRVWYELACGRTPSLNKFERSSQIVVNLLLPARPGRITAISDVDDLRSIPGVVGVEMSRRVGDVVPAALNTSSSTGIAYLIAPTLESVDELARAVIGRFQLTVERVVAG